MAEVKVGTRAHALLTALVDGPKTAPQLADLVDDETAYVTRDISKLRDRGLVRNGPKAARLIAYEITDAGRAARGTETA